MKQKVFTIITLFCLFIVTCPLSGYAVGPDGFANVPWGASMSQVGQVMTQQGFSSTGQRTADDGILDIYYYGTLAGTAGDLSFRFFNGTFYSGTFSFHNQDGGGAELNTYMKFLSIIQSKYGSPTKSGSINPEGSYGSWDGLQAPGSSDTIQILLSYNPSSERCGGNFCTSFFTVVYTNESLQQRLAGRNKNGL
jgi:hypothetical protein